MRLRSLAVAALFVVASCRGAPKSVLDKKEPRFPGAEGVATFVSNEKIQIDGKRSYAYVDNVESFTTRSHDVTPLLSWQGRYVQLGLDGKDKVIWVAGIGSVVKTKPPYTLYSGRFDHIDSGTHRAVFKDGTTLAVSGGVTFGRRGEYLVTIDPARHVITKITEA